MGSDVAMWVMWLCGVIVAMWVMWLSHMGGRVGSGMVINFFNFFSYRYRQLLSQGET